MTSKKTNYAVGADRWDFRVSDKAFKRVPTLKAAYGRMAKDHPTGAEAMRDIFHGLIKTAPRLEERANINPEFWVNREVVDAAMDLQEFASLKQMGCNDPAGASIACTSLEPELQLIFDKLKKAEDKAKELAEAMAALEESEEDGDPDEEAQALVDQLTEELEDELSEARGVVQETMQEKLDDLAKDQEALAEAASWGEGDGEIKSLDPEKRVALAKKIRQSALPKVAEVFGRLLSMSTSALDQSHVDAPEEIYDIELGRDLNRMLPLELAFLDDDDLFYDWARRYTENNLSQYALHGTEDISKGGIVVLEDGSGSMGGDRGVLAKALGLALLKIARADKREFDVIHFGARNQAVHFNFDTSTEPLKLDVDKRSFSGINAVLEYAQLTFQFGGTDFDTPLRQGIAKLQKEYDETGRTTADLVMVTDGECYVDQALTDFIEQSKETLKFRIFGIMVDNYASTSVMEEFCDVIFTPKNILTGEGLEQLMATI